jgi:hypothetical protein
MELRERGHVVPARGVLDVAVDQGEKRLLSTATKGVVRLFNAVSKAQRDASDASKGRIQAGCPCAVTLNASHTPISVECLFSTTLLHMQASCFSSPCLCSYGHLP